MTRDRFREGSRRLALVVGLVMAGLAFVMVVDDLYVAGGQVFIPTVIVGAIAWGVTRLLAWAVVGFFPEGGSGTDM